jgi:hypothetical protein
VISSALAISKESFSRKGAKAQSAAAFQRLFFRAFASLREKY